MDRYIALLRGINVGGHNTLPMKELVELLEDMGCENVLTYIQSGNAVFQSDLINTRKFAEEISSKIHEIHGFAPNVHLLSEKDIEYALKNNPFDTKIDQALHFFFLESKPQNPDLEKLQTLKVKSEKFKLHDKVFYLFAPDGVGRSKLAAKVEHCLGIPVTARNWKTVNKLISMLYSKA